jgi:hypothetical protein
VRNNEGLAIRSEKTFMTEKLIPDPPHTTEETLLRIHEILRCAAAVVYESGDQHSGAKRDLPFAAMYLIDMAKALANHQLEQLQAQRAV